MTQLINRLMGLTLALIVIMTSVPVHASSSAGNFVDQVNAPLASRIEAYTAHAHDLAAQRQVIIKSKVKLLVEQAAIKAEHDRLVKVYATQLYTVLLSAFIDTTAALTLNPIELSLNTALEITEYQELVSGWSAKTGAERALATQRAKVLLATLMPSYENQIATLASQQTDLEKQYAFALSEILRLKGLYKQAIKYDYSPNTSAIALSPVKAQAVSEVVNAPQIIVPIPTAPGFTTPQEAADSAYSAIKQKKYTTLSGEDQVLPSAQWLALKQVYDNNNGLTRWLGRYQTPEFDPTLVSEWEKSAVLGGQQDAYIEVAKYLDNDQVRYQAKLQSTIAPNDPIETTIYSASMTGTLARGQYITFANNMVDPQTKLEESYWFARGKDQGVVKDVYIGSGQSLTTLIPADLYGFDSLLGFSVAAIDKYRGRAQAFTNASLASGINRNYTGIAISQLSPATPGKPVVFGGSLGLPEYGSVKIIIDYGGTQTTYNCIPTPTGAIAYCDFMAKVGVTSGRAKLLIYAGSTQIGEVDWSNFSVSFDKNYLSGGQLSELQSQVATIRSSLSALEPNLNQFSRIGLRSLLSAYTTNATYAQVISEHIKGNKDPNFQYTVQEAMDNDKVLIEYLDGLAKEGGAGDQKLVSALKSMKYKGYPEGLAFIDVFYLHLKAQVLNTAALDSLLQKRKEVASQLATLSSSANALLAANTNSDQLPTVQGLVADVQKYVDRLSDGGYSDEIIAEAKAQSLEALTYLESKYPEFSGYVAKYQAQGVDESGVRLLIKGQRVFSPDIATATINGRIMVPTRMVAETLNCQVEWRSKDQVVIITSATKTSVFATLPVQSAKGIKVFVDGKAVVFDVQPVVSNNRTLVAIRQISEALGAKVTWDSVNQTASID